MLEKRKKYFQKSYICPCFCNSSVINCNQDVTIISKMFYSRSFIRFICVFVTAVFLTMGIGVWAAESSLPVQSPQPTEESAKPQPKAESSDFIDLQLQNISQQSGREAAKAMLLGTLDVFTQKPELSPEPEKGLSFSGVSAIAFALVIICVVLFGWIFFRHRPKNSAGKN